jgi:TolA-binding protein
LKNFNVAGATTRDSRRRNERPAAGVAVIHDLAPGDGHGMKTAPRRRAGTGLKREKEACMGTKEDYQQKLEAQLREWQAKLDQLQAKKDQAEADQKIAYKEQIDDLEAKKRALEQKLDELQDAGGDAWEEVKSGTEKAWNDLDAAFSRALERFR